MSKSERPKGTKAASEFINLFFLTVFVWAALTTTGILPILLWVCVGIQVLVMLANAAGLSDD